MRIKAVIEYDGSNYHGFQRQTNAHTIQAQIESDILQLTGEKLVITGASRTDAGVHALGQVIAFDTQSSIPASKWKFALNSVLPEDIRIISTEQVDNNFNPRFNACKKRYCYKIYRAEREWLFYRNYAMLETNNLNLNQMQQACQQLQGIHNFKSFCASGTSVKSFEREVYVCNIINYSNFLNLEIEANGFLYNMVRIIVGTLLEIGKNKYPVDYIDYLLKCQDRSKAGPTVPPQGLYLVSVAY